MNKHEALAKIQETKELIDTLTNRITSEDNPIKRGMLEQTRKLRQKELCYYKRIYDSAKECLN